MPVAIDSSPLEGAGRVEDTLNLIAHAARKVAMAAAELLERDFAEVCAQAGIPLLLESSVKKALAQGERQGSWHVRTRSCLIALRKPDLLTCAALSDGSPPPCHPFPPMHEIEATI